NRVFPVSNQSESIITCLRKKVAENGVIELFNCPINKITKNQNQSFSVSTKERIYEFDKLVIATGSSKKTWQLIENLGHKIVPSLPSLFTFNCK
ncbi:MAG TPA: aminoacetone oxidase family FAD-binding enzyme, partial [Flavobacterium sp.]|nr:aminoacetone oxidase family FAD-binding enzyme [Flavobacterium sp.]